MLSVLIKEGKQLGGMTFSRITEESLIAKIPAKNIETIDILYKHDPSIIVPDETAKREFSIEEDQRILELYIQLGAKWSQIAKLIGGRTNIEIRNRFIQMRGRIDKARAPKKRKFSDSSSKIIDSQIKIDEIDVLNISELIEPAIVTNDIN